MIDKLNWTATIVFVFFFALVTVIGFMASRWKAGDLDLLHEWGLGGQRFGAWITWFLLGGDLYTAYTVIAIPAVVYAIGAYGFFAVPYTIVIYPFLYLTMPRLWAVSRKHGYITAGDFVLGRYGDKWLELAVALTGILATMPYIALQLVGMEKVIQALGFHGEGYLAHLPLTIAFVILALYTYKSGLRAPAMIAFVKDIMIYIFIIAAVIVIPMQLGGFGVIFDAASKVYEAKVAANPKLSAGLILTPQQIGPYITLAIGSAMALFMYPHALTGTLSASSGQAIRRNTMTLPAYSFVLGLVALLGIMAHAAGVKVANPQDAVPQLLLKVFPDWFAGFSFAAIAIGALVPAAIMSIATANTYTRNVYREFINPNCTDQQESRMAKIVSLVIKAGALVFIFFVPLQYALWLQLLGGVWIIQTVPSVVIGLYTRFYHGWGLFVGWVAGFGTGTWMVLNNNYAPVYPLSFLGVTFPCYIALATLVLNIVVATVLSLALNAVASDKANDVTRVADYV